MKLSEIFPNKLGLTTNEMSVLLNRKPQTLRRWATYQEGPIQPLRVQGRLLWLIADAQKIFDEQMSAEIDSTDLIQRTDRLKNFHK